MERPSARPTEYRSGLGDGFVRVVPFSISALAAVIRFGVIVHWLGRLGFP